MANKTLSDQTLIIQPLPGIGDMIWNLPFIQAIARHTTCSGKITLLAKRRSQADKLLMADDCIEKILWLERGDARHDGISGMLQLTRQLREQRFQAAWVLHQSVRYAAITRLAGIPLRYGYGRKQQRWWLSRDAYIPAQPVPHHPLDAGQRLLQHLDIPVNSESPYLALDHHLQQSIRQQWQLSAASKNIILGVGSSEAFKIWPKDYFLQLMQRLQQYKQPRFYLFGSGDEERQIADWIEQQSQQYGIDVVNAIARPTGITEAVHLCSMADLYIGNDTGFLNVSAALAIPAIGIFGASPPLSYSDFIHPVTPSQGALSDFDRSGQGMKSITAEMVYQYIIGRGLLE